MKIAFILITTKHGKMKIVSTKLGSFEEVDELYETYGRFDILAKVLVEDDEELKKFIQNKLLIVEGIQRTETLLAIN